MGRDSLSKALGVNLLWIFAQVIGSAQEWPGVTPKYPGSSSSTDKNSAGRAIFEFGRLRHNHEFVCDYESPLLSSVQAMGLAVACSAPKRAFLYI